MAHAYSVQSSSTSSSPLFQYPASLSLLSTRKQLWILAIGSIILMFVILSTMILCFVDCVNKRAKKSVRQDQRKTMTLLPIDVLNHSCSSSLINGKPVLLSAENSSEHRLTPRQNYSSTSATPVLVLSASSNSHSLSSVDSTTRANTVLNRGLLTNTYTYTPLNTCDEFFNNDFDNRYQNEVETNGMEFMMTTV